MNSWASLEGTLVWVTGGAGYLGAAITRELDRVCAQVVCIDLPGKAADLVASAKLSRTVPVVADLSNAEALPQMAQDLISAHGLPDGLIHLAFAPSSASAMPEVTVGDFRRTVDLSLTSTFALCRFLAERMKVRGTGSIVLFSSMYGMVAPDKNIYRNGLTTNPVDYGATKAAVLQLSRYMAMHYGDSGVRINCVSPGPFPNPQVQADYPVFIADLKRKTFLGRVGEAREIVGPALFLLTDSASFVTGQNLVVDGGWTSW